MWSEPSKTMQSNSHFLIFPSVKNVVRTILKCNLVGILLGNNMVVSKQNNVTQQVIFPSFFRTIGSLIIFISLVTLQVTIFRQ